MFLLLYFTSIELLLAIFLTLGIAAVSAAIFYSLQDRQEFKRQNDRYFFTPKTSKTTKK